MSEDSPIHLYCDGGVIGPNPSLIGGTWAWCQVNHEGNRINYSSGVISPQQIGLPKVTNNVTELVAALYALRSVDLGEHNVILHTDSQVTKLRLTFSDKFVGVPDDLRRAVLWLRNRKPSRYEVVLMAGHPTKEELELGHRKRNKFPTSIHNQWCDKECTRLADEVKAGELIIPTRLINWAPMTEKRVRGLGV